MKKVLSVLLGAVIAFGLLFCMTLLVKDSAVAFIPEEVPKPHDINFDTPYKRPQSRALITPPKMSVVPVEGISSEIKVDNLQVSKISPISLAIDETLTSELSISPVMGPKSMLANNSALPVLQTQADYPIEALLNGVEGWVTLSYDINQAGQVINIKVVAAKPRNIFNSNARKALSEWKYKPALENGEPIASKEHRVKIVFSMPEKVASKP